MKNKNLRLNLIDHPLIKRDITVLRDEKSNPEIFRAAVERVSIILAVKLSTKFSLNEFDVKTPLENTAGFSLKQDVILIPVLRAGLGMVNGFLKIIPEAKVGHIGLQRDEETLEPKEYYYKTPKGMDKAKVVLIDPMLATGGSSSEAIKYLKNKGAKNIIFACLVAAPEGVQKLNTDHPDVDIFVASLDRELNDKGYILPGLGDAGDRTFGTL